MRNRDPQKVSVTGLAYALNLSREHVSRNYKKWGFEPIPGTKSFRVSDIEIYVQHGTAGLKAKNAERAATQPIEPLQTPFDQHAAVAEAIRNQAQLPEVDWSLVKRDVEAKRSRSTG